MSFTLGHAQKALSIAIKHEWCHGGFIGSNPDCCPIDSAIISGARAVLRAKGSAARFRIPWSQIDTFSDYRMAYQLVLDAANGIESSVWELFTFNGRRVAPTPISVVPTTADTLARQNRYLGANPRAARFGAPRADVERFARRDAVRSSFMQSTWPWNPRVSAMTPSERRLRLACEDYVGITAWNRAEWYSVNPARLTRAAFEKDMLRLRRHVLGKFGPVV
jgi:hypothetical protein